METSKILGQNIQLLREAKGVKQEVLAKHLGITKGRMSQIENGYCRELTVNWLEQIAVCINVSINELFIPPQKK